MKTRKGIEVEILDTYEIGGVPMVAVEALDGTPFRGGDKWPVWTSFATMPADELIPDECECTPDGDACTSCRAILSEREMEF